MEKVSARNPRARQVRVRRGFVSIPARGSGGGVGKGEKLVSGMLREVPEALEPGVEEPVDGTQFHG